MRSTGAATASAASAAVAVLSAVVTDALSPEHLRVAPHPLHCGSSHILQHVHFGHQSRQFDAADGGGACASWYSMVMVGRNCAVTSSAQTRIIAAAASLVDGPP